MEKKGKIEIDRERCKGCHVCIDVCPRGGIEADFDTNLMGYQPARFNDRLNESEKGCTACMMCALVCPETAIEVYCAQ